MIRAFVLATALILVPAATAEAQDAAEDYLENGQLLLNRGHDAAAVVWWRRAADQGNVVAQHNLGVMYANGRGVPQNYAEAYKWWSLAAAQGYAKAVTNRDRLLGRMTPAQIDEGRQLAAAWRPA
jgi:TPR repeat protein